MIRGLRLPRLGLGRWLAAAALLASLPPTSAAPAGTTRELPGVTDLDGRGADPFSATNARAVVLVFFSIECPICQRYAPELRALREQFTPRGADLWLVQPGSAETPEATRRFLQDYNLPIPLLRDPRHALVKLAGAKTTPEAAVFLPDGRLAWRGRIDNRFADFGKARPAPTRRDLRDALEAVLAGKRPPRARAPAVGCPIAS
jgi:hypothetical protein